MESASRLAEVIVGKYETMSQMVSDLSSTGTGASTRNQIKGRAVHFLNDSIQSVLLHSQDLVFEKFFTQRWEKAVIFSMLQAEIDITLEQLVDECLMRNAIRPVEQAFVLGKFRRPQLNRKFKSKYFPDIDNNYGLLAALLQAGQLPVFAQIGPNGRLKGILLEKLGGNITVAVAREELQMVKMLAETFSLSERSVLGGNFCPLTAAVNKGSVEIVKYLLDQMSSIEPTLLNSLLPNSNNEPLFSYFELRQLIQSARYRCC
ncbi:hypothetical protein HDU76_012990 [Blyttiomyces sp. JEL0837]|nr:hypothetical protein HDU76_012990 [Blyttiomyces sp. JEL0837]